MHGHSPALFPILHHLLPYVNLTFEENVSILFYFYRKTALRFILRLLMHKKRHSREWRFWFLLVFSAFAEPSVTRRKILQCCIQFRTAEIRP